jgi:L,D-peptidoglycan transpeptidase YkuD (ErfK/YbiS/YcfS/YnhG family)
MEQEDKVQIRNTKTESERKRDHGIYKYSAIFKWNKS